MSRIISSRIQAERNVTNYQNFIHANPDLQMRLSMHRAWYAIRNKEGWIFGNSKIIGYADLTPEAYLAGGHDGRQTEAVLRKWFVEVNESDPLHDELWEDLSEFLARYGKKPSKLARINVSCSEVVHKETDRVDAICSLIFEVAKGLDPERIKTVRKKLKTLL